MINNLKWIGKLSAFLLFTLMLIGVSDVLAVTTLQTAGFSSGQYAIGFKAIEKYDYSRVFSRKLDYLGNPIEGERARPIQVCIWYPAVAGEETLPMVYGEYNYPYPADQSFARVLAALQNRELQHLQAGFRGNNGAVLDLLSVSMTAVRDAPAVEEKFPLIIYHSNWESTYNENALLCEFLASHGFVIATTHCFGASETRPTMDPASVETYIRDHEFVLGIMRGETNVDHNRLGLLGNAAGATSAILMQMRNPDVDVVVTLEAAFLVPVVVSLGKDHPNYNPRLVGVPLLSLYGSEGFPHNSGEDDSMLYADRYTFVVDSINHRSFTHAPVLANMTGTPIAVEVGDPLRAYPIIGQQVLDFFKANLTNDNAAQERINNAVQSTPPGFASTSFTKGEKMPPTPGQFRTILAGGNYDIASELFYQLRETDPGVVLFDEARLNAIGYGLLGRGQTQDAMKVFKMNTVAYPSSANSWDSYSDACISAGENDLAREALMKVSELLPLDSTASEELKEQLRNAVEQKMLQIEQQQDG